MGSAASTSVSKSTSDYAHTHNNPKRMSVRMASNAPLSTQTKTKTMTKRLSINQHGSGPNAEAVVSVSVSMNKPRKRSWYKFARKTPVGDEGVKNSALAVRILMVGEVSAAAPQVTRAEVKPDLSEIKTHLVDPESANRVIAELRVLPVVGNKEVQTHPSDGSGHKHAIGSSGPLRAVCLQHTELEHHNLYVSKMAKPIDKDTVATSTGIITSSIEALVHLLHEVHVVDLLNSDMGVGQPGNGHGLLAGAIPTAETVLKGFEQVTPQLMALGYTTSLGIYPDHRGIHPPTDRMSVLTYWWGLEILLPPPTLAHLSNAESVTGTVMNYLTAISLVVGGIRELLPLARYIAQFIDFEFEQIQKQDEGKGVICAATWIMPAALVPRPWDFPDPPSVTPLTSDPSDEKSAPAEPASSPTNPETTVTPPAATTPGQTVSSPDTAKPEQAVSPSEAAKPEQAVPSSETAKPEQMVPSPDPPSSSPPVDVTPPALTIDTTGINAVSKPTA